jgi:hypothetical protein
MRLGTETDPQNLLEIRSMQQTWASMNATFDEGTHTNQAHSKSSAQMSMIYGVAFQRW